MGNSSPSELARTPLASLHDDAGAKFAPFAGWAMPLSFEGTVAEHMAVREDVGVFDVSHLGTVWVTGPAAGEVIDASFSNDPQSLADGQSQYTLCLDERGGVIDDLIVYRFDEQRWLAIPNAGNTAAVVDRLRAQAAGVEGAAVDDATEAWAILAVQGPQSSGVVQRALGIDLAALPWGGVAEQAVASAHADADGTPVIACRTGYTGERGGELLAAAASAPALWQALRDEGATACGLGARDTLRLEMGYPLHGAELNTEVNPWQARLGWAVRLDDADGRPRQFPGRDAVAAAREDGPSDRLWGLRSAGRRPLRAGYQVVHDGRVVGTTTSGGFSPTLGVGIALARLDGLSPGDAVAVEVRGKAEEVEVVRPPFVDRNPRD